MARDQESSRLRRRRWFPSKHPTATLDVNGEDEHSVDLEWIGLSRYQGDVMNPRKSTGQGAVGEYAMVEEVIVCEKLGVVYYVEDAGIYFLLVMCFCVDDVLG